MNQQIKDKKQVVVKGGMNDRGSIDFVGKSAIFTTISFLAVVISLGLIFTKGFRYGIDFAGGNEIQVQFPSEPPVAEIRSYLNGLVGSVVVQTLGENHEVLIRMQMAEGSTEKEINEKNNLRIASVTSGLKEQFKLDKDAIRRVDTVGPQVGEELKTNGLLAILYSLILILVYIGLRFDFKYAPSAVLSLFHDTIITLGVFSLLDKEVNIHTLAAVLTIIGYSLNDTIVTFDRMRENEVIFKGKEPNFIINRSLNDVLSRTVLTSITTLITIVALYVFAGGVIEDLAFAFALGVIIGTYSTMYVASPLVVLTEKIADRFGFSLS